MSMCACSKCGEELVCDCFSKTTRQEKIAMDKPTLTTAEFDKVISKVRRPIREFHCGFNYISKWLAEENEVVKHGVQLTPDFQRGRVWTEEQQVHYIQNVLRGLVDDGGLTIRFNCPSWKEDQADDSDLLDQVACIDGLQRLTAILEFVQGDIDVFGYQAYQLPMARIMRDHQLVIKMYDFQYKSDLLNYYLDINSGGTPHTQEELDRVKGLLNG
jgi:hypothetical protein